ncbi:AraC family transcriptional regulator [Paenibacillus pasadenensis]|uniref:AraC family transcriptional regulator n=1 Tax=Paenibacillus pasadenensis TaxID=217090 RepID=UPI0003F5941F|nr:AraC family transcriptional regulator [Paenibacillus pasadenensis]
MQGRTIAARLTRGAGSYYRKSLILLLVVASIPGIITSVLVYAMAGGNLEKELLQQHVGQIEQRARTMDAQLANLEMMLSHWAFDTRFDYSLQDHDFVRDFIRTRDLTSTLLVMQGSNAMIGNVSLYLQGEQPILFDPEYSSLQDERVIGLYDSLLANRNKTTYWTQLAFDPAKPQQRELAFVHPIPGSSLKPFGALVARLDREQVAEALLALAPYDDGDNFLVGADGGLFVSAHGHAADSPFIAALRARISTDDGGTGSFLLDWDGRTYAVTSGQFGRIMDPWMYVSASPITTITAPVVFVSRIILGVSVSALLLGLLLAWLASGRIYSPIKRLMGSLIPHGGQGEAREDEFTLIERHWRDLSRESRELNARLTEQLPYVKESFLHQLLQGYLYAYSEEDLLSRLERYKWDVRNRQFIVLYVQLSGIASLEGKFKQGDEGLVTFASVNIIDETAARYFEQYNAINFHDLGSGLLLILPEGGSFAAKIRSFCEELMQSVNRLLHLNVTVAISRSMMRASDVPRAFEAVKQAASFRNFDDANQVIDMEQSDWEGSPAPTYPFALERELLQALRAGQAADAKTLLGEFQQSLSVAGAKAIDVHQGMLQLLGSVQHAILASGIQPSRLYKGANLYEQLSQIKEPEHACEWFSAKVFEPYLREMETRSNGQTRRLIEQAVLFLQRNYMRDISLDHCADHIGTNPFFLSKSFKQVTGVNFIDYLTGLRVDKAKELLRESELKIQDIAEQVGYQHSYFNRIFKKLEGMTPTRYRMLSRPE